MAFVVHVVGWGGSLPPPDPRWRYVRVRPAEVVHSVPARLLIVGREVLVPVDVEVVRRWSHAHRCRLIVCLATCETSAFAPWQGLGILVGPEKLSKTIEQCARELDLGLVRWPLEPHEWLPSGARIPPLGSFAALALRCLPDVYPIHDIEAWCLASNSSYSRLWRALRDEVGLAPRDVYLAFVSAQVAAADSAGESRSEVARMLGYADASALGHAVLRARSATHGRSRASRRPRRHPRVPAPA